MILRRTKFRLLTIAAACCFFGCYGALLYHPAWFVLTDNSDIQPTALFWLVTLILFGSGLDMGMCLITSVGFCNKGFLAWGFSLAFAGVLAGLGVAYLYLSVAPEILPMLLANQGGTAVRVVVHLVAIWGIITFGLLVAGLFARQSRANCGQKR